MNNISKYFSETYDIIKSIEDMSELLRDVIDYNDFMNIISTYYNQYLPTENTTYTIEISIKE